MDNLEWARGGWLFLLPVAIAGVWFAVKLRQKTVLQFANLQFTKNNSRVIPVIIVLAVLEGLILIFAILSIAGPQRTFRQKISKESGADIALALDISASMMADDFKPNRLESLKQLTNEFLEKAGSNRFGVYVFAKHVFTQTPLTTDVNSLKTMIGHISYEMINHATSGGTAIGTALVFVHDNLKKFREEGRDQAIILVTDGESSYGVDPEIAARQIAESGMRLYIIGMAGEEPVPLFVYGEKFINNKGNHVITSLDDKSLKKIAKAAGGKYYRAIDENVLRSVLSDISRLEKTPLEIANRISVISYAPYFSLAALVLSFIWFGVYGMQRRPLQ
ncbi:MAG: VWA domain-containing protein [Leptospiraceae bacterium]|nr:VWA domain-containing protein [Leptospiraceae bacterium]